MTRGQLSADARALGLAFLVAGVVGAGIEKNMGKGATVEVAMMGVVFYALGALIAEPEQ